MKAWVKDKLILAGWLLCIAILLGMMLLHVAANLGFRWGFFS